MEAEIVTNWPQRIARWIGAWLLVQTLILGLFAWFFGFQVLVRGASVSYVPAGAQEAQNTEYAYYEPERKKK